MWHKPCNEPLRQHYFYFLKGVFMKLVSYIASVLLLVNFTSVAANATNIQITNIDYTLVSAKLDENRFSASNVLIALTNMTDSTLSFLVNSAVWRWPSQCLLETLL